VPFYVRTGKRLPTRVTEVALRYRQVPHLPLPREAIRSLEPNTLVVNIQPDEGIEMRFGAKVPNRPDLRTVSMRFCYRDEFSGPLPEAYERVLLDALTGDASIFIRADEVEHSWRVVQPFLDAFASDAVPLATYPAGTWGPVEAAALLRRHDDTWRVP
jgi:glucose-6-phosphate 1-dehydrogenase